MSKVAKDIQLLKAESIISNLGVLKLERLSIRKDLQLTNIDSIENTFSVLKELRLSHSNDLQPAAYFVHSFNPLCIEHR